MLLSLSNITKYFNGELLFKDISFSINNDDKIALIGDNGTGKSTLLKIILNEVDKDSGTVHINTRSIGYLSQNVIKDENNTLYEEVEDIFKEIKILELEIEKVLKRLEIDPTNEEVLSNYGNLEQRLSHLGGYDYKYKIDTVLSNFKFTKEMYNRKISTFSGGEKTRANFAKLLLSKPDLLILDEPTNHLDIYITEWLEKYLNDYEGAILVVTHDKYFINKVCSKIIELENNKVTKYSGNYDFYINQKEANLLKTLKEYSKQQKEIKHMEDFVEKFRYKSSKAKQAQDRIKKLSKIDKIEKPNSDKKNINLSFKDKSFYASDSIIKLKDVTIGYNSPLVSNIELEIFNNDKVSIIGPNGEGKTTLLNAILYKKHLLSGDSYFNKNIKVGYFEQIQKSLHIDELLFDHLHNLFPTFNNGVIKGYLNMFLFTEDDYNKKVSVLSGGEKVRLSLLIIMLKEPNVLILDEPTNHLDISTKTVVEQVIKDFTGTVILVSHDRYFINKVSNKVIEIKNRTTRLFEGDYDYYKKIVTEEKEETKKVSKQENKNNKSKEINYKKIEIKIDEYQSKIDVLEKSKFNFDVYANSIKLKQVEKEIEELNLKIETLLKKIM